MKLTKERKKGGLHPFSDLFRTRECFVQQDEPTSRQIKEAVGRGAAGQTWWSRRSLCSTWGGCLCDASTAPI